MYIPGNIFYFTPFYFIEGGFKPKYFITLHNDGRNVIVAALPSSQDHVPRQIEKKHGCLDYPEGDFNAYWKRLPIKIKTPDNI
jgi:hypothetical protein